MTWVCKAHGTLPIEFFRIYDAPAYKGVRKWKRYKCKLCQQQRDEERKPYLRKKRKDWAKNNRGKLVAYNQAYLGRHPDKKEQFSKSNQDKRKALRLEVLTHYSTTSHPTCACCGEPRLDFLVLDHENGGGNQERKKLKKVTSAFYKWVKSQGYPMGYRVLCHNCNMAIGAYGRCPHEDEKS